MKWGKWTGFEDLHSRMGIALFIRGETPEPKDWFRTLNERFGGRLTERLKERNFKGKLGQVQRFELLDAVHGPVYAVGLHDPDHPYQAETLRRASSLLAQAVKADRLTGLVVALPVDSLEPEQCFRAFHEGLNLSFYRFDRYRVTDKDEEEPPPSLEAIWTVNLDPERFSNLLTYLEIVEKGTFLARDLVNEPAIELYPEKFARIARDIAAESDLNIKVLDETELEALGAGCFLSVGRGSERPPRLIHLIYQPSGSVEFTLGLVGKGITFDSGGLSLKPTKSMVDMKGDMAGAAAVLAAMMAIGKLKPQRVAVHGILCCAENMPSGHASRPGDIVRAMNGKTVEITNTDAEGRLVLADGMVYAVRNGAEALIDLATLTGAAIIALGTKIAAVLSNDSSFRDEFLSVAEITGESFWPLPLEKTYRSLLETKIATIKNSANGGEAGTIQGALFLSEFTEGKPWIHLDIAGPAFLDKPFFYLPEGGTGFGVRTLVEYIMKKDGKLAG